MYNKKRIIIREFDKIKLVLFVSLVVYLLGIIIGALNTDSTSQTSVDLYYDFNEHIYRCVLYILTILLVANSCFGIPFIIYFLYVFGVNNGVVYNLYFSLSGDFWGMLHVLFFSAVLSCLAAVFIGVSSLEMSKKIFTNAFLKKSQKLTKIFLFFFIMMLFGFSFYYFSDIYKLKLLEYIK